MVTDIERTQILLRTALVAAATQAANVPASRSAALDDILRILKCFQALKGDSLGVSNKSAQGPVKACKDPSGPDKIATDLPQPPPLTDGKIDQLDREAAALVKALETVDRPSSHSAALKELLQSDRYTIDQLNSRINRALCAGQVSGEDRSPDVAVLDMLRILRGDD